MHPPYELSARVCCDESNCFHTSSSTAMRASRRAEEAMETTGMLAQRFERSASFDKAQDERMIEPVMVSLPNH
jgi:hypothetical protein